MWRFPNVVEGEREEELGMVVDHEGVPETLEPIDEGEQSEGLLEHPEVFNCFLHGYPALLYRLLTGARSDLTPRAASRMRLQNDFK